MEVIRDDVSRTERFAVFENGKIVSRAYLHIPHSFANKPIMIFKVKTNKSHRRMGLCRQIFEQIIASYGRYNLELRPHVTDVGGMNITQLKKFYKSFGFKKKRNGNKYYNTMRRDGRI